MKHHLVQYLEDNLKGKTFTMTSPDNQTHHIYPCSKCDGVMYAFYDDSEFAIVNIELDNIEAINIARRVWNYHSGLFPMSKRNFVDFLIFLNQESKEQSKISQN